MEYGVVIEVMLSIEPYRLRVMLTEEIECVDKGVVDSVKPEDLVLVLGSTLKAVRADLPEMLQQGFRDQKRCLSVLTGIVIFSRVSASWNAGLTRILSTP